MQIMTLYAMFFFHILDDFHLQGILASMKQKQWWKDNAPDKHYRYDYLAALIIHAISWTIMIMVPICWAYAEDVNPILYSTMLILNTTVHAYVDDLKANQLRINLIEDQLIHAAQIIVTWLIMLI